MAVTPPVIDRVSGMLLGVAIGDALGAAYEYRCTATKLSGYTGIIDQPIVRNNRFQGGKKFGAIGMVTDDTEATIALARAIIGEKRYSSKVALQEYLRWANSGCQFMGRNTRALFYGIKTEKGYAARVAKASLSAPSEGNGCLMRATPLAVLRDWEEASVEDCKLTNPTPNSISAVKAYVCAVHALLEGCSVQDATALAFATLPESKEPGPVATAIAEGQQQAPRNVTGKDKGWVVHGLYCAFLALHMAPTLGFQDRIDAVIRLGGDTDTNAAIAGGMLGALMGHSGLLAEQRTVMNANIVMRCDPGAGDIPRPPEYSAAALLGLAGPLAALIKRDAGVINDV